MITRTVILGGGGGFGSAFAARIRALGGDVVSVDRAGDVDVACDVERDASPLRAAATGADVVLLCVPEPAALAALIALDDAVSPTTLLVDICSVKSRICAAAVEHARAAQYVSLHPMFSPAVDFAGSNAAVVTIRDGERVAEFRRWLLDWGLNVVDTDAESHDKTTALVQAAAHAVLCGFGHAIAASDAPPALVRSLSTPVFGTLAALTARVINQDPTLYHNIQTSNPYAAQGRESLEAALIASNAALSESSPANTEEAFHALRPVLDALEVESLSSFTSKR